MSRYSPEPGEEEFWLGVIGVGAFVIFGTGFAGLCWIAFTVPLT